MIDWGKIKNEIISETKNIFITTKPSIGSVIDLFISVINFDTKEKALDGIKEYFSNAIQKVLDDDVEFVDKCLVFPNIGNIEKFCRKLTFLIDKSQYKKLEEEKKGLSGFISFLELNPNNINYNLQYVPLSQRGNYAEQLLTAYNLRNITSHNCESWNRKQFYENLQSCLVIYLFACQKHYEKLYTIVDDAAKKKQQYRDDVIRDFKKWNSRFVAITGKEQIREIPLYAIETSWNNSKTEDNAREGNVEDLRSMLIREKQNQMIIVGQAGIGKTTTLQYMAYRDALSGSFPIYVELKLLTQKDSLMETIKRKINFISSNIGSLLSSTQTCLFLDGLNELLPSIKESIYREITNIISSYPNIFVLISTRAQDYEGELGLIPVFSLQKMDVGQIRDFLKRNTTHENVRKKIINEIESNNNWLSILGTPLILYMLIQVVQKDNIIPDDENKIILKFIKNLYDREKGKDISFDKEYFHGIMCMIAFEGISRIGNTNSGFSLATAMRFFSDKNLGMTMDKLKEILQKGVELNLLVKDDSLYSFSHQSYQETLAGDYFNSIFV